MLAVLYATNWATTPRCAALKASKRLLKCAIYPQELVDQLAQLNGEVARLHATIDAKDAIINDLKTRVVRLETAVDDTEQYSRRPNLRIQGIAETGAGEDARAKVLTVANTVMKLDPPLQDDDLERRHRIGRQTEAARPRLMIVRFKAERTRDQTITARGAVKAHNQASDANSRLFINEDLTQRRSQLAYLTRKLKADKKITDCWTYNGHVMVKQNNNNIRKITSPLDLDIY